MPAPARGACTGRSWATSSRRWCSGASGSRRAIASVGRRSSRSGRTAGGQGRADHRGGSGIGRACAVRFAEEGAQICAADLSLEGAEETARLVAKTGARSLGLRVEEERHFLDGPAVVAATLHDVHFLDVVPTGVTDVEIGWTRDPFDRLLVAHARLRGWRIATSDSEMLHRLGPDATVELWTGAPHRADGDWRRARHTPSRLSCARLDSARRGSNIASPVMVDIPFRSAK